MSQCFKIKSIEFIWWLFSLIPKSCRSYLKTMRLTNITVFMPSYVFFFVALSIRFGKCIDGNVNLFTLLMMYRARVKYYKWAKNMLKIHSKTNFLQTHTVLYAEHFVRATAACISKTSSIKYLCCMLGCMYNIMLVCMVVWL